LSASSGRVVYRIGGRHIFSESVGLAIPSDLAGSIKEIRIDGAQADGVLVSFEVAGLNRSEAKRVTTPLVDLIQDWLVLDYPEVRPITPQLVENTIPDDPGADAVSAVLWGLKGETQPILPHRLDKVNLERFEVLLQQASPEDLAILSTYRLAREDRSVIAEFVLLYSILLWITRNPVSGMELQARVDERIWELDPSEDRVSGARRGNEGTRYTKLRNDIGHLRRSDSAAIGKLRQDVGQAIGPLRSLVRQALHDRLRDLRLRE
jgi:hypothetical protein